STRKDVQRIKSIEKRIPNGRCAAENFVHEQKEKWQRDSKENHRFAAPNPFVNTGEFVADRREKGQNGKLCSDVSRCRAGPVNLGTAKTKTMLEKVARNRRNIAL